MDGVTSTDAPQGSECT